ncbi:MAG: DUF222 domain-containing protein [Actinobacteria bacterium]|nr:DUF222 domain-containing protein [Actinomycetota bacterium]
MSIRLATKALRDALSGLEPALYSGEDAAVLAEDLATTEKVVAGARAAMAARAAECGAHRGAGHASPTEWMARLTGKTPGEARRELETTAALDQLSPETKADVAQGALSLAEVEEIAKTEQACPGSEAEMRDVVKAKGLRGAREKGRRLRQAATDIDELDRKRRDARQFSHWEDELGMIWFKGALRPEDGVPFVERLERESERLWRDGDRESTRAQRLSDAFLRMVNGEGEGNAKGTTDLVVVWDMTQGTCHIPGVGFVHPDSARAEAVNAFFTAVTHDGVDIQHVKRLGRKPSVEMLVALGLGSPPDFDGAVCVDCGDRAWLDYDHVDPYAHCQETALANLEPRCRGKKCHQAKTERDREVGLLGPDPAKRRAGSTRPTARRTKATRPERARAP